MEHAKQSRSALTVSAADALALPNRAKAMAVGAIADAADDDATFAGTPEELEALLRGGGSRAREHTRRWPLGVAFLVLVAASLLLWGGLFLLLR